MPDLNDLAEECLRVADLDGGHPDYYTALNKRRKSGTAFDQALRDNVSAKVGLIFPKVCEAMSDAQRGAIWESGPDGKGLPVDLAGIIIKTLEVSALLGVDIDTEVRASLEERNG